MTRVCWVRSSPASSRASSGHSRLRRRRRGAMWRGTPRAGAPGARSRGPSDARGPGADTHAQGSQDRLPGPGRGDRGRRAERRRRCRLAPRCAQLPVTPIAGGKSGINSSRTAVPAQRIESGAERSRTLSLLNAMRRRGVHSVCDRARTCARSLVRPSATTWSRTVARRRTRTEPAQVAAWARSVPRGAAGWRERHQSSDQLSAYPLAHSGNWVPPFGVTRT